MLQLQPDFREDKPLRLLCIGAHSDDIEIGCGGTILTWLGRFSVVDITWVVLSADELRAREAHRSASALLKRAADRRVIVGGFRDGFLPEQYGEVKGFFEKLKETVNPDIVFTHCLHDRHQDHRLAGELTWNTWRDHLVLEYEIPKYEGDLQQPNAFVAVSGSHAKRKASHLNRYFQTQRAKDWFEAEKFLALMRIRGMECRARSGFAEGFYARKLIL